MSNAEMAVADTERRSVPKDISEYFASSYRTKLPVEQLCYLVDYYATRTTGHPVSNQRYIASFESDHEFGIAFADSVFVPGKPKEALDDNDRLLIDQAWEAFVDLQNQQPMTVLEYILNSVPVQVAPGNHAILDLSATASNPWSTSRILSDVRPFNARQKTQGSLRKNVEATPWRLTIERRKDPAVVFKIWPQDIVVMLTTVALCVIAMMMAATATGAMIAIMFILVTSFAAFRMLRFCWTSSNR